MLRFLESADHYNSGTGGNAKWQTFAGGAIIPGGRNGQGIQLQVVPISKTIDYQTTWIVGFAYNFNDGVGFSGGAIYQLQSNGTAMATLRTNPDGTLSLYAGNTFNIITSSDPLKALHLHTWYYFEIKMLLTGGSGAISLTASVRVNGVVFCAAGSALTGVAGSSLLINDCKANMHSFTNSNITGVCIIDDIYIADAQAGHVTDFIGDINIFVVYPRQDVVTDWNSTGASHFDQVNEQYAESNPGSAISSNTAAKKDNFNWQPISPFTGSIIGIHYGVYLNKDGEGTRTVNQTVGPVGGYFLTGPDISPSDTFVYFFMAMDLDPGTSSPWLTSDFNAMQFGVNLVA